MPRETSLQIQQHRPLHRCCLSTLLQSECKNCVVCWRFSLKYFCEWLKICEIKTLKNLVLYGSTHVHIPYLEGSTTVRLGITMWYSPSAPLLFLLCRSVDEYSTAEGGDSHFEVAGLFRSIGSFIGIFLGSFLLGCTMALLTALVSSSSKYFPLSKWRNDYKNNAISSSSSRSDRNKCAICWVVSWVSHAPFHGIYNTHTHYRFS